MSRPSFVPILAALLSSAAFAQNGALDTSFGNGGLVEIPWFPGAAEANAVGIDSVGRIIVGGDALGLSGNSDFALFRLLTDGTFDVTYASDNLGFRLIDFDLDGIGGRSNDIVNDLAVLGDDSVVAAGEAHFGLANSQFALAKLNATGALDTSFGQGGSAHFGFNTYQAMDQGQLIRLDDSGRIVIVGTVVFDLNNNPALAYWAGIARLTTQGKLDSTFYGSGLYDTPIWGDKSTAPTTLAAYNFPSSIILDSSQRIVITGSIYQPFPQAVGLMRGPPDGGYDPGFGTQGTGRVLLSPSIANASATWPLTNGRLMVSGTFGNSQPDTPFLMRLNEDGSVDTTFANGLATTPELSGNQFVVFNFLQQTSNGGWLLAGQYGIVNGNNDQATGVMLVLFDASGNPDLSFGTDGIATIVPDPNRPFVAHRIAAQSDGKLIVAGSMPNSASDATSHFAVIRISTSDTIFANGFDTP